MLMLHEGIVSLMLREVALQGWSYLIGLDADSCATFVTVMSFYPRDAVPRGVFLSLGSASSS